LIKKDYRGDVTKAAPYLSYQAFDGNALALLANVSAACGTQELKGTFTSENGNPTIVKSRSYQTRQTSRSNTGLSPPYPGISLQR
jgi:hypothetical protein